MTKKPRLAKSYDLTPRELHIDGEVFPYYIHEDGPRIEATHEGRFTTLWVPILIDQPCPQYGAPDLSPALEANLEKLASVEAIAACPNHLPVQHRDGKPPWCNTCGLTTNGQKPQEPARRDRSSRT